MHLRSLLALLLLAGCGGETSLESFATATVELDARGEQVTVWLLLPQGRCPSLGSDVRARLNGRELPLVAPGGEARVGGGWTCQPASFSLARADLPAGTSDARLEIEDGAAGLVLEAPGALAARRLEFEDAEDGGSGWSLRWEPGTDALSAASWRLDDGAGGLRFGGASVASGRVQFELPPGSSAGALRVDAEALAPVERCEGAARCEARVAASAVRLLSGAR